MVKLYAGLSGSGKTRQMLHDINEAVQKDSGSLVCIEMKTSLRYDVNYKVRLIEYQVYGLEGGRALRAFISGLHAGNFDITQVFLKSIHRLLGTDDMDVMADFCDWCASFGEANNVDFTMTARVDPSMMSDRLKKYT